MKQKIVTYLNFISIKLEAAYASSKYQFLYHTYSNCMPQQYLALALPLQCSRIICQLRINSGFFYYKHTSFDFNQDHVCNLCNLNETQNIKHILYYCHIHKDIRQTLIQYIPEFADEDFDIIVQLKQWNKAKIIRLYHYLIALLTYRHYILHLENM